MEGKIKSLWTFNGVVHMKFTLDSEEPPMKILHKDDIIVHELSCDSSCDKLYSN